MYKYLIAIILLSFLSFPAFSNEVNLDNCYVKYFTVSGYYSPKKGQDFYYRGDYNSEIRLNGNGYRGASGKEVFNGMIAAPRSYNFGTKIYFPGYGVGEVSDRGQAIVEAGVRTNKYDRIDIWMGKGDQALKRALSFGKRVMKGYVCPSNTTPGFDMGKFSVYKNFFKSTLWGMYLTQGRGDKWVETLQNYLNKLGYIKNKHVTGYFGPITKSAVCKYQTVHGIVSKDNWLCGYFGPKTRQKLKDTLLSTNNLSKNEYKTKIVPSNKKQKKQKPGIITFNKGYIVGEESKKIKHLQKYLKDLGYYNGKLSGTYTKKTAEAVYEFQSEHNIINGSENIKALGYLGPKTRKVFHNVVRNKLKNS